MSDEYVTDPELLKKLNGPSDEYVTDPELMKQLGTPVPGSAMPDARTPTDYAMGQGAQMATRPGVAVASELSRGGLQDVAALGKIAYNELTPAAVGSFLTRPLESARELGSAYLQGHPWANTTMKQAAGNVGKGLVQGALAPENMFTMPYTMAAYEQEKIRQNPNSPGLEYNPYAQTVRGEAKTQGQAGAANQMRATANMPYGNVTPHERAMLEEDARMKSAIRKKAFEKVMGPVVPGSF